MPAVTMPDDTDEAGDIPGHIVQGLLRERDEARAELASERGRHAEMEREMLNRGAVVFAAQQQDVDEARAAHLSWKAEAHRLASERDDAHTESSLRTMMTKAAIEERDEARAIARRFVEKWRPHVKFSSNPSEHRMLKDFDALPWAKDDAEP